MLILLVLYVSKGFVSKVKSGVVQLTLEAQNADMQNTRIHEYTCLDHINPWKWRGSTFSNPRHVNPSQSLPRHAACDARHRSNISAFSWLQYHSSWRSFSKFYTLWHADGLRTVWEVWNRKRVCGHKLHEREQIAREGDCDLSIPVFRRINAHTRALGQWLRLW